MKLISIERKESFGDFNKKEKVEVRELIGFKDGEFKSLVTVRWYMGRTSSSLTVYCQAWFYHIDQERPSFSGHGQAGGGGYCKLSTAYYLAAKKAGLEFDEDIAGFGMDAVDDSLVAYGEAMGFDNLYIARG